jgi:hypothetical protein
MKMSLSDSRQGEPPLLPAEIWHHIINLLAEIDVWSAARCQFLSTSFRMITLSDSIWRKAYEQWTGTLTDPNLTDWYTMFVSNGKCYFVRPMNDPL